MSVFLADTSHLKNRSLVFAFASSPYIVTTWIGGYAAQSFIDGAGWRWGFGTFAIVMPIICSPLIAWFLYYYRKARKQGLMPQRKSNRTILQSIRHYVVQFDLLGILLLAAGMALFLLPFSIYSYQAKRWASSMIICMLVFGIVLLVAFVAYEALLAPVTFIPFHLMTDRTILGASLMYIFVFVSQSPSNPQTPKSIFSQTTTI
jgi:MFS family permease